MRITYIGSGLFEIDGDTLSPGETTEVSEERGELLLQRFPDELQGEKDEPKAGKSKTEKTTEIPPIAQSTPADTAPSDSTGVSD